VSEEEPAAPRTPADLAGQLRAAADRIMAGWTAAATGAAAGTGAGAKPPIPALPTMPATMSARQMESLLNDLAARRAQVQALTSQLQIFDEQLASLEANLRPMLEWTRTWANVESAIGDFWRPLSGGSSGGAAP
jgi:hypothetical protein